MVSNSKTGKRRTKKRGVSIAVYHRVSRMIAAGLLASWAEAERKGFVLPPATRGRKRKPVPTLSKNATVRKVNNQHSKGGK